MTKDACCYLHAQWIWSLFRRFGATNSTLANRISKLLGCNRAAGWRLVYGPTCDDYTESCTAHVGELLTDAAEHRIYPMWSKP